MAVDPEILGLILVDAIVFGFIPSQIPVGWSEVGMSYSWSENLICLMLTSHDRSSFTQTTTCKS